MKIQREAAAVGGGGGMLGGTLKHRIVGRESQVRAQLSLRSDGGSGKTNDLVQ